MGRLAEYSDDQILKAGNTLESVGKRVSPFAIREKLGGGDPNRIKKVWDEHKENSMNESKGEVLAEEIELPTEIQEALDKNLKVVHKQLKEISADSYKVATVIAEKRVTSTIEEYLAKIAGYEESEKDAFQSLENSDRQKEELEDQVKMLNNKNEALVTENSKLIGVQESLQTRVSQLEKKEAELSNLQIENGRLQGKLEIIEASRK